MTKTKKELKERKSRNKKIMYALVPVAIILIVVGSVFFFSAEPEQNPNLRSLSCNDNSGNQLDFNATIYFKDIAGYNESQFEALTIADFNILRHENNIDEISLISNETFSYIVLVNKTGYNAKWEVLFTKNQELTLLKTPEEITMIALSERLETSFAGALGKQWDLIIGCKTSGQIDENAGYNSQFNFTQDQMQYVFLRLEFNETAELEDFSLNVGYVLNHTYSPTEIILGLPVQVAGQTILTIDINADIQLVEVEVFLGTYLGTWQTLVELP